ncbi:MAG TPA: FAD-binding oxidoreductase [Gemmatimonadaceae bacterium]|nr:FAD-binding oxidoreductase [Gemmatimonadaceae bacterium]
MLKATATGLAAPPGFSGTFRQDDAARAVYGEGAGIARFHPRAVAVPASEADVVALVRGARKHRLPLIPRGSGSGMAGGGIGDGVIVDLSRLRAMGSVDAARRCIRVGPGILRGEVDRAARAVGLRFPVDPSSGEFCTVGGMASTNAAGAHTLRHGAMRPWVRALRCVFDDGSIAEVRRGQAPPAEVPAIARFLSDAHAPVVAGEQSAPAVHADVRKNSSGYATADYARSGELVDLLVGSEGTLAIFTELELSLEPVPAATASLLGAFATLEQAVDAAVQARAAGAAACELLDRTFLDVAASGGVEMPIPAGTEAVLLAEVEAPSAGEASAAAQRLEHAFRAAGATHVALALDADAEHRLWALRHAASPILSRLDPSLKSMQFIEDGAVPPARLPDYVRGVRAALERHGVRGVIFGHAGDAHVHVNPLIDVRLPDWHERLRALLDDVVALTASLGGTLAGEHGDGRLRTPLLHAVWSDAVRERFALVKSCFDPLGVLNPGVKVPLPGEQPVGEVKYDPALPALPPAAARALATVERDRAYATYRLALLDSPGGS